MTKKPKLVLSSQFHAGKRIVEVRGQRRPPTYAEAVDALERAEQQAKRTKIKSVSHVCWYFEHNGLKGHSRTIVRCECGEVSIGFDDACRTCRLLASLIVETEETGPRQVRFERAERALNRLAELLPRLQREAKGQAA